MGSPSPELSTPSSPSTPQTIRLLYGHSVAKNLLQVTLSSVETSKQKKPDGESGGNTDDDESWAAEAHFTNVNYQAKKMVFLLFINSASFCVIEGIMTLATFLGIKTAWWSLLV
jgi:DNA mismatch repair protein MLH1